MCTEWKLNIKLRFMTNIIYIQVYAFHWTRPSPPELLNMTLLLEAKGMFADVGRHVLSCKREATIEKLRKEDGI